MSIKTRIAPSPTGTLHIGTARTALFNYLFAKQQKGEFVLRIEDTDQERSMKENEEDIIRHLEWLGLSPDKPPVRQSERTDIYHKHLDHLIEQGSAFWCYHTTEEIQQEQEKAKQNKQAPVHWCEHKENQKSKIKNQKSNGVLRFATPRNQEVVFKDKVRGEVRVNTENVGDFSIAKDATTPLYNFAVVIDDHDMSISHVIRGEDHITNTPKQILLYKALGWDPPKFAHLPLILGPDKAKMSKRHGATSVAQYRQEGYLPEALINFMALLGWHPADNREHFNLKQLIKEFSLNRVKRGGAVFNVEKLNDLNEHYIRELDREEFTRQALPFLQDYIYKEGDYYNVAGFNEQQEWSRVVQITSLEKERIVKLSDIPSSLPFIWNTKLDYEAQLLIWKEMEPHQVKQNLEAIKKTLEQVSKEEFQQQQLEETLMPVAQKQQDLGRTLWPLRVALTGQKASPGPFEVAAALGKKRTLERIETAIAML